MSYSDNVKHLVWAEKYRPFKIDECILPEATLQEVKGHLKNGSIPNLLFSGSAGTGKTTLAHAICNELDFDVLFINGSDEGRLIDTLRTKIRQFASTNSLESKRKCIIIDEFDNVGSDTQLAMRAAIDDFSKHCSFILTCNFPKRIIDPIISRMSVVDFTVPADQKKKMAMTFLNRVSMILDTEEIDYDKKSVAAVIMKTFPDFRKCLNTLQGYSAKGKIDTGSIASVNQDITEIIEKIESKDFAWIRTWVFSQPSVDIAALVRGLDDNMYTKLDPSSVPEAVLIFARYEDMFTRAIDPQITVLAMLTELMATLEFRNG